MIKEIINIDERAQVCEKILRSLPKWFAVESGIQYYINAVKEPNKKFLGVVQEGKTIGFAVYTEINNNTTEIDVMGILPEFQRFVYGSKLIGEIIAKCQTKYLIVKTSDESPNDTDNYALTRNFYLKNGFERLLTLPEIWGEQDPCLIMIKVLDKWLIKKHYG